MFAGAWGERLNKQETTDPPGAESLSFRSMWVHLPCLPITHVTKNVILPTRKKKKKMIPTYTSVDQLPLTLCAEHVAMALGISRAGAYTLLHSKGFPTIKIGKRLVVPRDKFIKWMEAQAGKTK